MSFLVFIWATISLCILFLFVWAIILTVKLVSTVKLTCTVSVVGVGWLIWNIRLIPRNSWVLGDFKLKKYLKVLKIGWIPWFSTRLWRHHVYKDSRLLLVYTTNVDHLRASVDTIRSFCSCVYQHVSPCYTVY